MQNNVHYLSFRDRSNSMNKYVYARKWFFISYSKSNIYAMLSHLKISIDFDIFQTNEFFLFVIIVCLLSVSPIIESIHYSSLQNSTFKIIHVLLKKSMISNSVIIFRVFYNYLFTIVHKYIKRFNRQKYKSNRLRII